MNYRGADTLARDHKQALDDNQVQANCCPFCGAYLIIDAAFTKEDSGCYRGTKVTWAKPPILYVLTNIFNYFVRQQRFPRMYVPKEDS